jgi:hypothetical protein
MARAIAAADAMIAAGQPVKGNPYFKLQRTLTIGTEFNSACDTLTLPLPMMPIPATAALSG